MYLKGLTDTRQAAQNIKRFFARLSRRPGSKPEPVKPAKAA
jgi:hypothetical protein